MWFCPCDGTLLQIRTSPVSSAASAAVPLASQQQHLWFCPTCPYSCTIDRPSRTATSLNNSNKKKKRAGFDDVLGGASAWENVDRTAAICPACHHHEAYFLQMQIRSADEPMSVFYKCCQCSHQWNDR